MEIKPFASLRRVAVRPRWYIDMNVRSFRIVFRAALVAAMAACAPMAPRVSPAYSPPSEVVHPQQVLQQLFLAEAAWQDFLDFYRQREFRPLWLDGKDLSERGRILLDKLAEVQREGLEPNEYGVAAIRARLASGLIVDRVFADLLLSRGLHRYAADMGGAGNGLAKGATADDIKGFLNGLAPDDPAYHALRAALNRYLAIAAEGGWETVPPGTLMKPARRDGRVPVLRRRLAAEDIRAATATTGALYDTELADALRRFQTRHGLDIDGIVGPQTLAALNVPAERRVAILAFNLRRLRTHLSELAPTAAVVNIPGAELWMIEDGTEVLRSRVIVGRRDWPTPLFRSTITELVFNPYWTVPPRIARLEMLPRIRRDPGYLARQGIRVLNGWDEDAVELDPDNIDWLAVRGAVPYILRQDPGPLNPLGRVKFMFANPYHVYLHDTPKQKLFDLAKRTLSHGCIRVEGAALLAMGLLAPDPAWPVEAVASAMASDETVRVRLIQPVPLYLINLTAWADVYGTVHFRPDSYGDDQRNGEAAHGKME